VDVLLETEVTPDQIDHLGHMNVRYYAEHARTGASSLLATLGLGDDDQRALVQRDSYTRHHHEQLVGEPLEVRGGVLDAGATQVRLYEELRNPGRDELAATFVLTFEAADRVERRPVELDPTLVEAAASRTVELPEAGRPRSIELDEDVSARAPTLAVLRERGLAMREVRSIEGPLLDGDGFVRPLAVPELIWGGEPLPGREYRPVDELPGGGQMGVATMETRATWARLPRAGDRVQSFGADLSVGAKTMLTRNWLLDVDRGDVVATFSVVGLAFDMGARRSVVIPDAMRERIGRRLHADLA
jgi:acyl-CoA thioester hydrolase